MSLATSCAHCGTVFRVAQDQLTASEGWVRCGHCRQVFNALERLFDLADNGRTSPVSSRPAVGSEVAPRAPGSTATGFRYSESFPGQFQSPAVVGAAQIPAPPATVIDPTDPSWLETRPAAFAHRQAVGLAPGGGQAPSFDDPLSMEGLERSSKQARPSPVNPEPRAPATQAGMFYTDDRSARVSGFAHEEPLPTSAFLRRAFDETSSDALLSEGRHDDVDALHQVGGDSVYVEDPGEAAQTTFEATTWAVGWIPPQGDGVTAPSVTPASNAGVQEDQKGASGPSNEVAVDLVDPLASAPELESVAATSTLEGTDTAPVGLAAAATALHRREPDFSSLPEVSGTSPTGEVDIPITVMDDAALDHPLFHVVADPWQGGREDASSSAAPEAPRLHQDSEVVKRKPSLGSGDFVSSTLDRPGELFLHSRWDETSSAESSGRDPHGASATRPAVLESEAAAAAGVPTFVQNADRAAKWRRPWVRTGLVGLALLGLSGLGVQAAVQWRQPLLARWPQSQTWLDLACRWTDCRRDAPRRLDALVVDSTALSQPPGREGYRLQVQLSNRSDGEVAAPWVDLVLTDPNGGVVVRRTLSPGEFQQAATLGPHAEASWQVDFSVPGHTVNGYTLGIFYP